MSEMQGRQGQTTDHAFPDQDIEEKLIRISSIPYLVTVIPLLPATLS
jgi:hypothetical protein